MCLYFDSPHPEGFSIVLHPPSIITRETAVKLFHKIKINKKKKKERVGRNIHDARIIVYTLECICMYIILCIIHVCINARVCVWRTVVGGGHVEPGQRDFYPSHSAHSPNSCMYTVSVPFPAIILYTGCTGLYFIHLTK